MDFVAELENRTDHAMKTEGWSADQRLANEYRRLLLIAKRFFPADTFLESLDEEPDAVTLLLDNETQPLTGLRWVYDHVRRLRIRLGQLAEEVASRDAVTGIPTERVYPARSPYVAYKDIRRIFDSARERLTVVDNYVSSELLELLEPIPQHVNVRVLTWQMQGDFRLAAKKFGQQRGNFEARETTGEFHDRFILADDRCFHIGASLKDAGGKTFAMSLIEDESNRAALLKSVEASWRSARPLF